MSSIKQQLPATIRRFGSGKPAQITFTLDFHELVTGDLISNAPCLISYDPLRLVPKESAYIHGDPSQPVTLHYQFEPNGPVYDQVLESPAGLVPDTIVDPTGQGSMLQTEFFIPKEEHELIIWFSFVDANGMIHYDSDLGKNYHFRFTSQDIQLRQAVVTSDPQTPYSGFGVEVAAIPEITQVSVRFTIINNPDFPKSNVALNKTGETTPEGMNIWSAFGIAVPYRATVRFKLYYALDGQQYKDDNGGKYFLAPVPEPVKTPPQRVAKNFAK